MAWFGRANVQVPHTAYELRLRPVAISLKGSPLHVRAFSPMLVARLYAPRFSNAAAAAARACSRVTARQQPTSTLLHTLRKGQFTIPALRMSLSSSTGASSNTKPDVVQHQVIDYPRFSSGGDPTVNAVEGTVTWNPVKSAWVAAHTLIGVIGGALYFEPSAILLFLAFGGTTLCLGHSLGMHRKLIHNSFECPKWLEYSLVHLGTLIGMEGPIGMIRFVRVRSATEADSACSFSACALCYAVPLCRTHDIRDWAQRQTNCHDYYCHRQPLFVDAFWQVHWFVCSGSL